jgi:hypothetical protein
LPEIHGLLIYSHITEPSRTLPSRRRVTRQKAVKNMPNVPVRISSRIIVAAGAIVSIVGLAGCTIFSITPSGTISLHPVFTAVALIGIAIVIGSSFVEAGAEKNNRNSDDPY